MSESSPVLIQQIIDVTKSIYEVGRNTLEIFYASILHPTRLAHRLEVEDRSALLAALVAHTVLWLVLCQALRLIGPIIHAAEFEFSLLAINASVSAIDLVVFTVIVSAAVYGVTRSLGGKGRFLNTFLISLTIIVTFRAVAAILEASLLRGASGPLRVAALAAPGLYVVFPVSIAVGISHKVTEKWRRTLIGFAYLVSSSLVGFTRVGGLNNMFAVAIQIGYPAYAEATEISSCFEPFARASDQPDYWKALLRLYDLSYRVHPDGKKASVVVPLHPAPSQALAASATARDCLGSLKIQEKPARVVLNSATELLSVLDQYMKALLTIRTTIKPGERSDLEVLRSGYASALVSYSRSTVSVMPQGYLGFLIAGGSPLVSPGTWKPER